MAISTALVVSSYAKDSTGEALPSQAAAAANEIIFTTDMDTNNNGDVAGPPTDGAGVYPGRLIVVRKGLSDEEIRYITSESGAGPVTCVVHEDWIVQPAGGDSYHIFYGTTDMDTAGNNFKEMLKRVDDWAAAQPVTIASGGGFALLDGHSIETVDNSSTTAADIVVQSGGRLDIGYIASETPVGGGYIVGTPAVDGELVLDIQTGGEANFNDFFMTCVKTNKSLYQGTVIFRGSKLVGAGYTIDLTGVFKFIDSKLIGRGTANEYAICDTTTNIDGLTIINSYGLTTPNDSVVETITVKGGSFVNMVRLLQVYAKKTWIMINPSWVPDETTQNDIDFVANDANSVEWHYSFDVTAAKADATVVPGVSINIYEGLLNQNLLGGASPLQTDIDGKVSTTIIDRIYTDGTTNLLVANYGGYILRAFKHTYMPVVSALSEEPLVLQATMLNDVNILETNPATAISAGPTVDPLQSAVTPHTLLFLENGVNTLGVGETITANGGATGIVVEISEGDSVSGKVFLKTRNATAFIQAESLSSSGTWTGNVLNNVTFYQDFTWWIDGQSKAFQTLYDWQSAELANSTLSTLWQSVHEWAAGNLGYMLHFGGSGYYTERSQSEGVFVSNRGSGTLAYLTADDGSTWTPAATVTIQVTVIDDSTGLPLENANVLLLKDSDKTTQVLNGGTNASGIVSAPYSYTADFDVVGWARQMDIIGTDYTPKDIGGTVNSSGLSITVRLSPI